jgi:nucleotide-binding universal stress UspA family protein
MISTVAVGTDGSPTAEEAVKQAADLARRFGAKLVLLSAFPGSQSSPAAIAGSAFPGSRGSPAAIAGIELQWASSSQARVRTILERSETALRQEGIECETRSDEGDPADVLVRLAEECGADLLVIGNKGMKRRVLGSVPNTVTHKAPCSVMVVKTT